MKQAEAQVLMLPAPPQRALPVAAPPEVLHNKPRNQQLTSTTEKQEPVKRPPAFLFLYLAAILF
ncbi:hypothetical protein OB13_10495 [Pontibacter sp. HJ8]